jgi:hypothetical protein
MIHFEGKIIHIIKGMIKKNKKRNLVTEDDVCETEIHQKEGQNDWS